MTTSQKQRDVQDEFGEPFWDVVKGFADDGYSIGATAGILGYRATAFRRLVHRHRKAHWFPKGQDCAMAKAAREGRKGQITPAMKRALEQASAANPCYKSITHDGFTGTFAAHARRAGIPVKTARNRYYRRGADWDYVFSKTSHTRPTGTRGHIWRN